jgi:hypothetical protein
MTDDQCPLGFTCTSGQCAASGCRSSYGVCGDAGVIEAGPDAGNAGDANVTSPDAAMLTDAWVDERGAVHFADGAIRTTDGALVSADGAVVRPPGGGCQCRARGSLGNARHGMRTAMVIAFGIAAAARRRRRG